MKRFVLLLALVIILSVLAAPPAFNAPIGDSGPADNDTAASQAEAASSSSSSPITITIYAVDDVLAGARYRLPGPYRYSDTSPLYHAKAPSVTLSVTEGRLKSAWCTIMPQNLANATEIASQSVVYCQVRRRQT